MKENTIFKLNNITKQLEVLEEDIKNLVKEIKDIREMTQEEIHNHVLNHK